MVEHSAYQSSFAQAIHRNLFVLFSKTEKNIFHFVLNNFGFVMNIEQDGLENYDLASIDVRREPFLFVQTWTKYRLATTIFCNNYSRNESSTCNIPGHRGTIPPRFSKHHTDATLSALKENFSYTFKGRKGRSSIYQKNRRGAVGRRRQKIADDYRSEWILLSDRRNSTTKRSPRFG